jgi:hypothetical protein
MATYRFKASDGIQEISPEFTCGSETAWEEARSTAREMGRDIVLQRRDDIGWIDPGTARKP